MIQRLAEALFARRLVVLIVFGAVLATLAVAATQSRLARDFVGALPTAHPYAASFTRWSLPPAGTARWLLSLETDNGALLRDDALGALTAAIAEAGARVSPVLRGASHGAGEVPTPDGLAVRLYTRSDTAALFEITLDPAPDTVTAAVLREEIARGVAAVETPDSLAIAWAEVAYDLPLPPGVSEAALRIFVWTLIILTLLAMFLLRSVRLTVSLMAMSLVGTVGYLGAQHLAGIDAHVLSLPLVVFIGLAGFFVGLDQMLEIGRALSAGQAMREATRSAFSRALVPGLVSLGAFAGAYGALSMLGFAFFADVALSGVLGAAVFALTQLVVLPLAVADWRLGESLIARWNRAAEGRRHVAAVLAPLAEGRIAAAVFALAFVLVLVAGFEGADRSIGRPASVGGSLHALYELAPRAEALAGSRAAAPQGYIAYMRQPAPDCPQAGDARIAAQFESYMKSLDLVRLAAAQAPLLDEAGCRVVPVEIMPFAQDSRTLAALASEARLFRDEAGEAAAAIELAGGPLALVVAADDLVRRAEMPLLLIIILGGALVIGLGLRSWACGLAWTAASAGIAAFAYALIDVAMIGLTPALLAAAVPGAWLLAHLTIRYFHTAESLRERGFTSYAAHRQAAEARVAVQVMLMLAAALVTALWLTSPVAFHRELAAGLLVLQGLGLIAAALIAPAVLLVADYWSPRGAPSTPSGG